MDKNLTSRTTVHHVCATCAPLLSSILFPSNDLSTFSLRSACFPLFSTINQVLGEKLEWNGMESASFTFVQRSHSCSSFARKIKRAALYLIFSFSSCSSSFSLSLLFLVINKFPKFKLSSIVALYFSCSMINK